MYDAVPTIRQEAWGRNAVVTATGKPVILAVLTS